MIDLNDEVKVIADIYYSYSNVIKNGEIVKVIYIYNNGTILIQTSNKIRVKVMIDKIEEI